MRPFFVILAVILSFNVALADKFSGQGCSSGIKVIKNLLVLRALDAGYATAYQAIQNVKTQEVDPSNCFENRLKPLCETTHKTTWDWTNRSKGEYAFNHLTSYTLEDSELSIFHLDVRTDQFTNPDDVKKQIKDGGMPQQGVTEVKCTVMYLEDSQGFLNTFDRG